MNPPIVPEAIHDVEIDSNVTTKEEIVWATKKTKNGKKVGPDGIPTEALKTNAEATAEMLLPLSEKIWSEEQVPRGWKEGHIMKLPKKGDLGYCDNYRGITLLSIPAVVWKSYVHYKHLVVWKPISGPKQHKCALARPVVRKRNWKKTKYHKVW